MAFDQSVLGITDGLHSTTTQLAVCELIMMTLCSMNSVKWRDIGTVTPATPEGAVTGGGRQMA